MKAAALLAVIALTGAALAGCGSGKAAPATVIVLPTPDSAGDLTDTTRAVQLSAGQVLAVQVTRNDGPSNWQQIAAGSTAVLTPDGQDTVKGCPSDRVGCGPTVRQRYRAAASGTTTIEWDYVGMGPGTLPSGVPVKPCSTYGANARCPVGIMKIVVTIR